MITKITGTLTQVLKEEVRLQVGAMEYQVLLTESGRRNIQSKIGTEVTLCTIHYFEGNPVQQGRMIPRLVGFIDTLEMEFFDLFCSVDKIGVKKALKAMARPSRDIANAIQREDAKWLTTLPGIGASSADQIVTSLKKKVTRFAMNGPIGEGDEAGTVVLDGNMVEDAYQALLGLGLTGLEARNRLDTVLGTREFENAEQIINEIFSIKS